MSTEYEELQAEIVKLTELTKSNKLLWERVWDRSGVYQASNSPWYLYAYCTSPDCRLEIGHRQVSVDPEDMLILVGEIVKQLKQKDIETAKMVELLRELPIKQKDVETAKMVELLCELPIE